MLFTIITINYNNKKGLEKTLQSVRSQSFKDFEFVVIDGGSNDGSRGVIERSRVVDEYISEPDSGIANAFNKGLALSSGDYVCFLNSGDIFSSSSVLEDVAEKLGAGRSVWAYGYRQRADAQGNILPPRKSEMENYGRERYITGRLCISHQASFFCGSIARDIKFNEEYQWLCMDVDFMFAFAAIDDPLMVGKVLVTYDETGISSNNVLSSLLVKWRIARRRARLLGISHVSIHVSYIKLFVRTFCVLSLKKLMGYLGMIRIYKLMASIR
ncbi:glycosyltransferase family 2 protein [Spongiibacter tropicus]|uniref:glycosyltransferase family 2 protein n=1 Tax=Spongiibacter tropicus TaxID=454602 RepID=UPI003A994E08